MIKLEDLPPGPSHKTGWPWNETITPLPAFESYPKISIVTPSYNQGDFIEETIRSVLLQGYPELEYIIIDGGSTDQTLDIIKKYSPWINHWVSEPDQGQTDAIQKGLNQATGVIWNWLNSDDLLEPNALYHIANSYQKYPLSTIISGELIVFEGATKIELAPKSFQTLADLVCIWEKWAVPQAAMFLNRAACLTVQGLDTTLNYCMDYELYLKLAQLPNFQVYDTNTPIARLRRHPKSKTMSQQIPFRAEIVKVFDRFVQQHPQLLPKQWNKSRNLFVYISALEFAQLQMNHPLSVYEFLQVSLPYLPLIWNYRYFWGSLKQKILTN